MNYFRALKSEFRRIISDKKLVFCVLGVFALFIAVISIFLAFDTIGNPANFRNNTEFYKECYANNLQWQLYLTGAATEPPESGVIFNAPALADVQKNLAYYGFLLDNNAQEYQFISPENLYAGLFGYQDIPPFSRGAFAQLWIMNFAFYPFILAAVIISALVCVKPYTNGIMKNYYASPVKRGTLFAGKISACFALCLFFWTLVLIWGLCFGAVGEPVRVLYYDGAGYVSFGLHGVFLIKMLGTLIAALFVACATAVIGRLMKSGLKAAAIVVIALAPFVAVYEVSMSSGNMSGLGKSLLPVIGLHANHYVAADGGLWALYAVYLALAVSLACVGAYIAGREKTY